MCSLSSSKLCCRNLRKVFDDTSVFGKLSVNDFKNICNLLGISISQQGCVSLYQEWLGSSEKKLVFHEFCLIVACYISSNCVSFPEIKYDYEVFLGGACNPTTWRLDTAIPFLEEAGISYYNPQVPSWSPELVEIEAQAKASSYVLLFVFEAWKTRAVSSFVEVTYLAAQGRNVVLVLIHQPLSDPIMIAGEQVLPAEQACLQQAKDHMCEFARGLGVPLFFQLPEALKYVRTSVMEHRELREKRSRRKFCSISSVEQQFIERVLRVRKVFNSLKPSKFGTVSVEQAHSGLQHLKTNFPCHSAFHEHTMKTLNFEQFSMAFACYVFQHSRAQSNSSSVSAALHPAGLTLRHSRSMYGHREGNWAPRVLRPLTSTVSVDQDDSGNLSDETSLRQQRFSQSMSFGGQSELTETSSPSCQLNAFKSWINGFRKRRVLSPDRFPDEPNCTAAYDLYVCGSLSGDFSLLDHNALSLLRLPANQPMSVFFADHPAQQLGSNVASTNPKRARVWARNHSRLLLYIVDSYSFSLSTMIEAAFAMGSGLPVVLCVNQLQVNEMVVQWSGEKRYPHVFHSTSVSHDPSSRIDYITGKTVRPDRHIESTTRIKSDSAQSSTSAFSSSWVKQASYPNDEIAGFTSSDMSSNGGESNSGSATASPACPGVNSILNPSVDSGLGLNTDSTELLDEHSDLDGSCIVSDSLHRCSAAHEKSASVSPVREKSVLPNLWEDSIFSMIVSNTAAKDHNRGRVYLTSIAQMMHIPVTSQIQEALDWCKTRLSAWPSSSSPTHLCTLPCD